MKQLIFFIYLIFFLTINTCAQLSINWISEDFGSSSYSQIMDIVDDGILFEGEKLTQESGYGYFKIDIDGNIETMFQENDTLFLNRSYGNNTYDDEIISIWNSGNNYFVLNQNYEGIINYTNKIAKDNILHYDVFTNFNQNGDFSFVYRTDTSIRIDYWDNEGNLSNEINFIIQDVLLPGAVQLKGFESDENNNLYVLEKHVINLGYWTRNIHKFDSVGNHIWSKNINAIVEDNYKFCISNQKINLITNELTDLYSLQDIWFRTYSLNGDLLTANTISVFESDSLVGDSHSQNFTFDNNNIYVAHLSGFYNNTLQAFLTKLNQNGEQIWFTELFIQNSIDYAFYSPLKTKFDTDNEGNIYYTGKYADSTFFITKLNPEGVKEWEQSIVGMNEGIDEIKDFKVVDEGLFYIHYLEEFSPNAGIIQIRQWKTNIETIYSRQEMIIAPNPFSHHLNLQTTESIKTLNIYNTTGQLIHSATNVSGSDLRILTTKWQSGVYFIMAELDDGQVLREKVVKF